MKQVTVKEIVERLGVTQVTVSNWRRGTPYRRQLKSHLEPVGKRHRVIIYENDLLEFLREYWPELKRIWLTSTH